MASEIDYSEDCCFNERRDLCALRRGGTCPCRCHVEVPVTMRPACGHEAEIERYRQRSRDEDTARIRLNHARIALRDVLTRIVAEFTFGDKILQCTHCSEPVELCRCVIDLARTAIAE